MKYFLLCALVIAGAFFSPLKAQEHNPCPQGGTLLNDMCTMPVSSKKQYNALRSGVSYGFADSRQAAFQLAITGYISYENSLKTSGGWDQSLTLVSTDDTFSSIQVSVTEYVICNYGQPNQYSCPITYPSVFISGFSQPFIDNYQCPPDGQPQFNQGPFVTESGKNLCYYPAVPAEPEPECDCANFAGDSLKTNNDLLAPEGQYTEANPPQCVRQSEIAAGRDTPLECVCQVSAQKWAWSYAGFNAETNTQMVRWQTRPTQIGQPSGTFTGVKCGSEDGGPLEPENDAPKDCFTLKNGVKWCWADKAEKCQIVNGVEQCASGCGTVNGDFVCYDDTPVIPPKDRDQLTPPDDTVADPNKSINDMVKGDFKEINKGVESRLDNVVTSITNTTIAMDEVSDKVGLTNSKLDGIGMQLDGIGKQLGHIDGTLEGAFGDDGEPVPGTGDGETCYEDICSWYESAYPDGLVGIWQERVADLQQTPMFDFVNQFTFQPSGSQPEMQLCFDIGSVANFGCYSLEIPQAVWLFLKFCILFTAAMLCRALIFGG